MRMLNARKFKAAFLGLELPELFSALESWLLSLPPFQINLHLLAALCTSLSRADPRCLLSNTPPIIELVLFFRALVTT